LALVGLALEMKVKRRIDKEELIKKNYDGGWFGLEMKIDKRLISLEFWFVNC